MFLSAPASAYDNDEGWPCVQRKVAKLSAGQMWAELNADEKDLSWQSNKNALDLVKKIIPRRVPLTETTVIIEDFANKHKENLKTELKQTFLALLNETNNIRAEIISGIGKFAKRQVQLSERIVSNRRKISEYEAKDEAGTLTKEEDQEFAKLEQQVEWDTRIREEREKSLEYVCEAPVILEQRLFALSHQLKKFY